MAVNSRVPSSTLDALSLRCRDIGRFYAPTQIQHAKAAGPSVQARAPGGGHLIIAKRDEEELLRLRQLRVAASFSVRMSAALGLDLLTKVGPQCDRAVIVQLLVTGPPHGIAHSLYLNLSSKLQSFPIRDVRNHELCLPNPTR